MDAEYLQSINVRYCPVIKVELTVGTGQDSDWSVDRAVNDHGYVASNLVIISVLANKAKADRPFPEIALIAESDALFKHSEAVYEGLTQEQWGRLLDLILPATTLELANQAIQYLTGEIWTPGQPYGHPAILQALLLNVALTAASADSPERRKECLDALSFMFSSIVERVKSKQARRSVRKMVVHMVRKSTVNNGWAYWSNPKPAKLFVEMWNSLDKETRLFLKDEFLDSYAYENGFEG